MNTINQTLTHLQVQGGNWLPSVACACAMPFGINDNGSEFEGKKYIKFNDMKI